MKTFLFSSLCIAAIPLLAQPPLGRYQIILDKSLLGSASVTLAPQVLPPPAPPAPPGWAGEYRMTMITKDEFNGSLRIGLQNMSDNSGLLLLENSPQDDTFRLLSADFERNQATVSYKGSSHVFTLESGSPPTPPAQVPAPASRGQTVTTRRTLVPLPRPTPVPVPPPAEPETPRFRTQEELDAHLKEVQMDAIRTGKPPLPIPLTPEMDAQLVREGVLPSQDSQ